MFLWNTFWDAFKIFSSFRKGCRISTKKSWMIRPTFDLAKNKQNFAKNKIFVKPWIFWWIKNTRTQICSTGSNQPKSQILFHKKRGHHRTLLERTLLLPLASESEHHTSSSSFLMMSVRPSMIASRMCLVASSNILTCSGSDLSKLNRGCLMRLLRSFFQQPSRKKFADTSTKLCWQILLRPAAVRTALPSSAVAALCKCAGSTQWVWTAETYLVLM